MPHQGTSLRGHSAVAVLSLASVLGSSCDAPTLPRETESKDVIPLNYLPALDGDYFEFHSRVVGRSFHIYVRLPENYDGDNNARYPAVYLLDGDSLFPLLASSHLFLNYDEGLAEAIVVGIAYGSFDPSINKRGFDFSAPAADADPEQGGAPAFQSFLKSELIPEIEGRYNADPSKRILFGQSRGGYMVLYSAFTDPDLFWGRIASNPAFDPGRELFFSSAIRASREDLGLVVTSGSRDHPELRAAALGWFEAWETAEDKPCSLYTVTIDGGTHAADSANSYRAGMLWLFDPSRLRSDRRLESVVR
jgi:predicted alpha/beta superfamily hydrolase